MKKLISIFISVSREGNYFYDIAIGGDATGLQFPKMIKKQMKEFLFENGLTLKDINVKR